MSDSQTNGHRRRHRRSAARGWRTVIVVIAAGGLFTAGVLVGLREPGPTSGPRETIHPRGAVTSVDAGGIQSVSLPSRANFNYSVIPGGARSAQELAHAIDTDSVVAGAYRDVDPETMRPWIVRAERLAYVSYRKNDRVFWTKKKVRIYEGETILTNGQTEIRGRCGNGISMEPLLPTSEDEPEETAFDALSDVGPLLVSFNLTPAGLPLVTAPSLDGEVGAPLPGSLGPLLGGGAGGFGTGGSRGESNDGTGGGVPPGFAISPPSGDSPVALSPIVVPGDSSGGPSGDGPGILVPPGLDPLVLQPLLGPEPNPQGPPTLPETPPVNATPVPEPATLLLFGSGVAALLARHRRGTTT